MVNRTSNSVKQQLDYIITMRLIDNMLKKENTNPPKGSIIIGMEYANIYMNMINMMLCMEYVDMNILEELSNKVRGDLEFISSDSKKRVKSQHTIDNDNMMSMILDFILSLQ